MGKWLAATCKGLSVAVGPFGAIGEATLKLYDDERSEEREKKLKELITTGQDVNQEALKQIFELKNNVKFIQEQVINCLAAIVEVLNKDGINISSPEQLKNIVDSQFFKANVKEFRKNGFIDVNTIEMECVEIFKVSDSMYQKFLTCVRRGGFDTGSLPPNYTKEAIISECIHQTFSKVYDSSKRKSIIAHLFNDGAPGSEILHNAHELLTNLAL